MKYIASKIILLTIIRQLAKGLFVETCLNAIFDHRSMCGRNIKDVRTKNKNVGVTMDLITALICTAISICTFLCWEFVAWFTHKYVMHGFLWSWHKSHHSVHSHTLERNDLFAIVFSIPSIALFYYGSVVNYNPYLIAVGFGIFCYGAFYLIFHDVIVHQRINWRPQKSSKYLQRMIRAHYIHHSRHAKKGCEAFGFLIVSRKYEPETFSPKQNRQETQ